MCYLVVFLCCLFVGVLFLGLRGGVHEVFPLIILTAVSVAAAFLVLSYITSSWGNPHTEHVTEMLYVGVDSGIVECGGRVFMYVQFTHRGLKDIVVYKVEVKGYGVYNVVGLRGGVGDSPLEASSCDPSGFSVIGSPGLVLRHGDSGWFYLEVPASVAGKLPRSGYVDVKFYTLFGSVFVAHLPVRLA